MKSKTGVVALMLFCIFAMMIFSVLALGVGAYKNITEVSRQGYDERLCLSYIWAKVKSADETGRVYVDNFHGLPALFIQEKYGDTVYYTAIYSYEGWIHELFYEDGYEYRPRDGVHVLRNESLMLEQSEDGVIKATVGDESVYIALRSGRNREGGLRDGAL